MVATEHPCGSRLNFAERWHRNGSLLGLGLTAALLALACGAGRDTAAPSQPPVKVYDAEFHVSSQGDDGAVGDVQAPLRTLEKARERVRQQLAKGLPSQGIAVWLHGGVYERSATLELGTADSGATGIGAAGATVDWRAWPGEVPRLVGGRRLDAAWFSAVTSASPVWSRLDSSARGQVQQVDLGAHGITEYGSLKNRGFGTGVGAALELCIDGKPMQLGRWPDAEVNDPVQDIHGDSVQVFGAASPDVTGVYVKTGVQDGVSSFTRSGLVAGLQYHLYRLSWVYQGNAYTAWFITTGTSGYPSNTNPWWYCYQPVFGSFTPATDQGGATGSPTLADPARINHGFASVLSPTSATSFGYLGDRPARWSQALDAWAHGYWMYAWADFHRAISSIDLASHLITLVSEPGYGIAAGQPWYAYNLLEEITVPGEWYLDRRSGILYLWPPAGFGAGSDVLVSTLEGPLFHMNGASHITLQDLQLEATRQNLVSIQGGIGNTLQGLTLRNAGASAADIAGTQQLVSHCTISGSGNGGVLVSGGDRKGLVSAGNGVEDCEIRDFSRFSRTYQPAIRLDGCGNVAQHNLIHDAPHSAILFGGNEHRIAFNEIHHVCFASSDAGAIYAGRDWGARGNVIASNFIHHIETYLEGWGVQGVYLDDCLSGIRVEGNVLYAISGLAIEHGGGRDNILVNNVIAKCGTALGADSRGYDWLAQGMPNRTPGDSWNLLEKLEQLGYQQEPWASRYPACAAIPDDWTAIIAPGNAWLYPEGSVFSRNLGWQNGRFISASSGAQSHYREMADNVPDQDPLFTDESHLDMSLRAGSPALGIPGFQPIPFAQIGIRK